MTSGAPKLDLSESPPGDAMGSFDSAMPSGTSPVDISDSELASYTEEQIYDAIGPMLHDLIVEIRRSLEYYTSRFQSQPDKIILCGGTSKLRNLDKLLESELGIPVVIGNPMANVSVASRSLSQDYLDEVAPMFPVGVGLAIRDMIGE